jgi:hypothetical protein
MRRSKAVITILLRIGLVRRRDDGSIRWPISVCSRRMWVVQYRNMIAHRSLTKGGFAPFGVFRNLPGFIKWEKGRLLPRRWGFHVFGLEVGDRG